MEVTLFIIRLLSALTLLAFLGGLIWVMLAELQGVRRLQSGHDEVVGRLVVLSTTEPAIAPGVEFPLKPVTGIGRGLDNTIIIDDEFSSLHHALVTLRGQQWWLEDLHSSNGTLLNNEPIQQAMMVSSGDNITIGTTVFRLEI